MKAKTKRGKRGKRTGNGGATRGMKLERRADSIPRAALGREVQRQVSEFGLNRELASAVVKDAASQMSRLMTGYFGDFSADRMVGMLLALGTDVTISLRHAARLGRRGRIAIRKV